VEIILKSRKIRKRKKIERDHQWYDAATKQMLYGRGGRMEFRYDPRRKRMIPFVVDHEEWVYEDNYPEISAWVKNNGDKYGLTVVGDDHIRNITIDIHPNQLEDIEEDLYTNNITVD